MKDMTLGDIFPKQNRRLNSLSIYRNGTWQFVIPTNPIRISENQAYYRISDPFGLVKQGVLNPKKTARRGSPGDYVALDQFSTYAVVTAEEYKRLFPTPNLNPPEIPNNSDQLKDPKFLTNILKGSGASASNSKTSKPTPTNTGY
tara:strand:+ start:409 stop:843 length:435 start_codon:yes stop_codon:yes gene_type:complete